MAEAARGSFVACSDRSPCSQAPHRRETDFNCRAPALRPVHLRCWCLVREASTALSWTSAINAIEKHLLRYALPHAPLLSPSLHSLTVRVRRWQGFNCYWSRKGTARSFGPWTCLATACASHEAAHHCPIRFGVSGRDSDRGVFDCDARVCRVCPAQCTFGVRVSHVDEAMRILRVGSII